MAAAMFLLCFCYVFDMFCYVLLCSGFFQETFRNCSGHIQDNSGICLVHLIDVFISWDLSKACPQIFQDKSINA